MIPLILLVIVYIATLLILAYTTLRQMNKSIEEDRQASKQVLDKIKDIRQKIKEFKNKN